MSDDPRDRWGMELRLVETTDVDAYVRMRCDPVMMTELGGPQAREGIEANVQADVDPVVARSSWILMIVPIGSDPADASCVAGGVVLWPNAEDGETLSEMGPMVLPEHQGKGLGKAAVTAMLERARADGRCGVVHAHPGVTNAASNGICRSLGFTLHGHQQIDFAGQLFLSNRWELDLGRRGSGPGRNRQVPSEHGHA